VLGRAVELNDLPANDWGANRRRRAPGKLIYVNAGTRDKTRQVSDARHDLGQYLARLSAENAHMWQQASTAPFDRDIELAVIDEDGLHALVFPCRRILSGWMKAETKERLDVRPTHWREWQERQNERHAV